jgi:Mg2+ and Co2+ transporters
VNDLLQPGHLPKVEVIKNYTFIIFRMYSPDDASEADTTQEVTDKVAIFISEDTIITISLKKWMGLDQVYAAFVKDRRTRNPLQVLNELIKAGLLSYEEPASKLNHHIEYLETNVFLKSRKVSLLKQLYFIKRKIDVIRRILLLTYEIIDKIDPPETSTAFTRDTRDLYVRMQNIFDSLSENTNQLLNVYFSVSAQRTNEIIRVLTIFSVFFMPLTFIVGIYGMNFAYMPELRSPWGYPAVLIAMIVVTVVIYRWFRNKGWL